jgi:hypothetical protein
MNNFFIINIKIWDSWVVGNIIYILMEVGDKLALHKYHIKENI